MKTLSNHLIHIRIKSADTIKSINKLLKIKNNTSINAIVNSALELALPQMLDTEFQTVELFADKLDKNTNKIARKINNLQNDIKNDLLKILIMLSSIENLSTFLTNLNLNNYKDLSDDAKKSMATTLPQFISEEKETLIKQIFDKNED